MGETLGEMNSGGPRDLTGASNEGRFVTITFDDGLVHGARKAAAVLDEFGMRATFYLVTGWIRPRKVPWTRDRWNRGLDHGNWHDWVDLQNRGHDIGSHTVTHLNASGKLSRYVPRVLRWELRHSYGTLLRHL